MKKPQPKREVAIRRSDKQVRHIVFYSTPDAAEGFKEFGWLTKAASGNDNAYDLFVDARYDFDEVLAYIEQYGQEREDEG